MILLLAFTLFAQPAPEAPPDTLHLAWCQQAAQAAYPLGRQVALRNAIAEEKIRTLGTRYLPAVSVGAQATYQSEVPRLPIEVPGAALPQISKDQYRVSLRADQMIYDGGSGARQTAIEQVQRDLDQLGVAVALHQLRGRINAFYFQALLLQAEAASLRTYEEDLRARRRVVASQVEAGGVLASNLDVLDVELIKLEQRQAEVATRREAALEALGILTDASIAPETVLVVPSVEDAAARSPEHKRPEFDVFALREENLTRLEALAAVKMRPRMQGFVEAAYGRPPGLDIFENTFTPFYTVGLRVQWPVWDWGTSRREQAVLALQRQAVAVEEETFAQNLATETAQTLRAIERLHQALVKDEEIIRLRQRITAQAASQLANGVITATAYLLESNAEQQARLDRERHRIQRAQAQLDYLTTIGAVSW